LLVIAVAAAWSLVVAMTGGVVLRAPWGRMSSRNPMRPFVVATAAALWYAVRFSHGWQADIAPLTRATARPPAISALAAILALAIGIQRGTFVASAADASGYVSQAQMWLKGELTMRAPAWIDDARWQDAAWTSAPLGYRPSEITPILVPIYSPGLPMMMAVFQAARDGSIPATLRWANNSRGCRSLHSCSTAGQRPRLSTRRDGAAAGPRANCRNVGAGFSRLETFT
jgi:hypothetical protein